MKNYAITVSVINTVDPDEAVIIRHVERPFTYAIPAARLYADAILVAMDNGASIGLGGGDYAITITLEAPREGGDMDSVSFHMDAGRLLDNCIDELDGLLED